MLGLEDNRENNVCNIFNGFSYNVYHNNSFKRLIIWGNFEIILSIYIDLSLISKGFNSYSLI